MRIQDESFLVNKETKRYKSIKVILLNTTALTICAIAQSYSLYLFNQALPTVKVMTDMIGPNESIYEGLLQASLYIGSLIGCFVALLYLQKLRSRRMLIRIVDLLLIIAMALSCITNYWTILIGRIIIGAMGGLSGVIIPKFVQEITPVEIYGIIGGFDKIFFSLGTTFQALAGLGFQSTKSLTKDDVNTNYWRFYVAFPAIFVIIRQLMMCFVFVHDSPIYNLQTNKEQKTIDFIGSMYIDECQAQVLDEFKQTILIRSSNKGDTYLSLFNRSNIKRTTIALVANGTLVMCGIVVVSTYSTSIFEKVFSTNTAQLLSLTICFLRIIFYSVGGVITQNFGITFTNFVGRRTPLLIGTAILIICNICLGVASHIAEDLQYNGTQLQYNAKISVMVLIFIFLITCFSSLSLIVMVHTPELMPEKGINMCVFVLGFVNAGNLFIFPSIKKNFGIAYDFWLFGGVTLCSLIFFYLNIKDTQGLNESQINILYNQTVRSDKDLLSGESDQDTFISNQKNHKVQNN